MVKQVRKLKKTTTELWETLKNNKNIEAYIEENKDELLDMDLHSYLNTLLKECPYSKSEIFKNANIQHSYGSHLFAGTKKNPSRNHLLQIAFGMQLDLDKTQRLLRIAGLSELHPRSKRDIIIIYCIDNKRTLDECCVMLEQKGCEQIYNI